MRRLAVATLLVAVMPMFALPANLNDGALTHREKLMGWYARAAQSRKDRPVFKSYKPWKARLKATAYCRCPICTGKSSPMTGGHGLTAWGNVPIPDFTAAADTSVFPFGTLLLIPGRGIVRVEDTGSAIIGKKVDLFTETHDEALEWGRRMVTAVVLYVPRRGN